MKYGIGTYLNQLIDTLLKTNNIEIIIINYLSDSYKEFMVIPVSERLTDLHIPPPNIIFKSEEFRVKYANRVVDFLIPYLLRYTNPIIQVNYPDALPIVRRLKSGFNVKILSVIHSAQWQFAFNGNKKRFIKVWTEKSENQIPNEIVLTSLEQEKELYELSDKIISVTKYMKEFVLNYYQIPGERVEVVYNGITNSSIYISNSEERKEIKHNLGFQFDEKIILFSGRLDKGKGLYFLLEAFGEVVKKYSNVRLVVVGEDSGPDKISQYLTHCKGIWGKVTFTGFVEPEYMKKLYRIADIGIIPSVYDHCPYVALEMLCNNLPLIVSNTEGLNEIIKKDQCIYLTPYVDEEGNVALDTK